MAIIGKEMVMNIMKQVGEKNCIPVSKFLMGMPNRSMYSANHIHFANPYGGSLVSLRTWHSLNGRLRSRVNIEDVDSHAPNVYYVKVDPWRKIPATAYFSPSCVRVDPVAAMDLSPTKLDYYHDMWKLKSNATILSYFKGDDGRHALILDRTVFHPQGGGQPADTGFITLADSDFKFVVEDVRSKDGVVFHYGFIENSSGDSESKFEKGKEVLLDVDEPRRKLNARLHSAGHLLDTCMQNVGLGDLVPTKGYHFADGPFVEYKGKVDPKELESKQKELELEANTSISKGGKVIAAVLSYEEAAEMCGGSLPDYIPKDSTPRIIKLGETPGCPCGGTHVSDISEIKSVTVSQIRVKKGLTKVFYNVGS
ncbi:uncharacterized protein LOC125419312 isoform X2 [Ziziphus jujuba]|uniref:Uncharacterized protein LOC125419312 isoform X2 n=1 Tax=Ziziphus jujuba TaxID=326968 RepID=A0ABM3I5H3_ZIZJJ|nr:uncharacterized protein LOC125419312 isoform X2 [Ziziphus jujuba]